MIEVRYWNVATVLLSHPGSSSTVLSFVIRLDEHHCRLHTLKLLKCHNIRSEHLRATPGSADKPSLFLRNYYHSAQGDIREIPSKKMGST